MKCLPSFPAFVGIAATVCCLLRFPTTCAAFQVLIDLNTFKAQDNVDLTRSLRCDGVWCIPQNSDLTDVQWRTVFNQVGTGTAIAEDNPAPHNVGQAPARAYDTIKRLLGRVDGTLCYNETGATPGATLLSNDQINADAATHGGKVIVLTRAYSTSPNDSWRKETDRCLANPKVSGVAMETVVGYDKYACDALLNTALRTYHKPVYFLLPTSKAAYVTQSIKFLQSRQFALMRDKQVFVVLCPYQTPGTPWFGPGTNAAEGTLKLVQDLNR